MMMKRTSTLWILVMLGAPAGCDPSLDEGRPLLGAAGEDRAANTISCADLGYEGECVADVSVWYEGGACQVRDCGSEGKTCGHISDAAGYGCLEGTQGATTFACSDVGYEGACLSDDVLVWAEGSACRWADCAALGLGCAWTDSVGYDCVESGSSGGDPPGGGSGGGLLTVGELVGGVGYYVSQDYGPTDFDGGYSYCHAYGTWGNQLVHCGVDVAIPYGTELFVPGSGTVVVSGETPYYEDAYNPAAGELRIEQDLDGAQVILGHMTQIDLWTGQHVTTGQSAGLSGTMNGPHVHIEVRVPDGGYASGFRSVDPMAYFGW